MENNNANNITILKGEFTSMNQELEILKKCVINFKNETNMRLDVTTKDLNSIN